MIFIAGVLDKHRYSQHFDHLLHLGRVQNHGGFDGQITALIDHQLVIRFRIAAGEEHLAILHSPHRIFHIPAVLAGTYKADAVQRVQPVDQCHAGGCLQIDFVKRLLENPDVSIKALRNRHTLGHHQIAGAVDHFDQGITAFKVVYIEFGGVGFLHASFPDETRNLCRQRRRCSQHQGEKRNQQLFHACTSSAATAVS